MKEVNLHYNYPQIRSMLVAAPEEWLVAGRGTGKSEGVLAPKSVNCYLNTMPRGCGVMVGATFTQILTRTLPAVMYGWEKMGYKRDVHYVVGQRPSEKWRKQWNWKGPFRTPLKFEYFISWWNGAGVHMVSQDRSGSSNGITIDWIMGDEAKLLNRDKLVTELFPANRGIIYDFKDNPYHHGKTFTTDMPVGTAGRWILEKEAECDNDRVKEILKLQRIKYKVRSILSKTKNKQIIAEVEKQCQVLDDEMNEIRMPSKHKPALLYYHEASTLENIHALGFEYIKQQMRDSTEFEFNTQILNKRPTKVEDGFYPDLDEDHHGYYAYNYGYIDTLGYTLNEVDLNDCRKDSDVDTNKPLHISGDWNKRIWPLEVAQENNNEIKLINTLHVLYPAKLKDVLELFNSYYRFHKRKTVYFWYDHTAVGELDDKPIYQKVESILTNLGWTVIMMYIGQSTTHQARYLMWGHLLSEDGTYDKVIRFNRENCKFLLLSMGQAGSEYGKDGFAKDKKPEKDPLYPAEEATHHSEALDTMITGMLDHRILVHDDDTSEGMIRM